MEHLNENCRAEVDGTFNKASHSMSVNNIVLNVNGHPITKSEFVFYSDSVK